MRRYFTFYLFLTIYSATQFAEKFSYVMPVKVLLRNYFSDKRS